MSSPEDDDDDYIPQYADYLRSANPVHDHRVLQVISRHAESGVPEDHLARLDISQEMVSSGIDALKRAGIDLPPASAWLLATDVYVSMRLIRIGQK